MCACAFSIAAACLNSLQAALAALAASLCVLPLAWKKRLDIARRLLAANAFILFLWLITPFTTPGEALWQWGPLRLSAEGVRLSALVTIKANALALVFLALVATLPLSSLGAALNKLRCPEKLTWMFLLMGRNIQILRDEWTRLWESARLRCFRPRTSPRAYRTIGSLLGLFLIRSISRAKTLHEALLLRGYDGRLPFRPEMAFRFRDYLFCLCCAASILLLILMEYGLVHAPA